MTDADTIVLPRIGAAEVAVEDPWGEEHRHVEYRPAGDGRWSRTAAWLAPGLLMGALGLVRVRAPGFSTDELATWGMATSTWRQNLALLRGGEASAGALYHLMIRAWAALFGASDMSLRVPAILAMAAAAASVGWLASRMFTPRTGLFAGLIFALLPTSTRYAQEAGPYALTALAAVLSTFLLVRAVQRPGLWRLAGYGAAVAALGLLHVVALLLLAAHGWAVLAIRRRVAGWWLVAASAGAFPAVLLFWLGARHSIRFMRAPGDLLHLLTAAPRGLFGVTALGLVLLALALFSLPLRYPAGVYTAWAVVPPLALLLSTQVESVPLPQGLVFTLPAWATLGAVALGRIRARWGMVVLVAIALVGLPVQEAFREADGHRQATRQLAAIIAARARPGDGVIYGSAEQQGGWAGRDAVAHYLPAHRRPKDVLTTRPQRTDGHLLAAECADVAKCLGRTGRLWVVRIGEQRDPIQGIGQAKEQVLRTKYQVTQVWYPKRLTLALLVEK